MYLTSTETKEEAKELKKKIKEKFPKAKIYIVGEIYLGFGGSIAEYWEVNSFLLDLEKQESS